MGNRPPYRAVSELAALTATHWRAVRLRLLNAGVTDPMGLPTMHRLLDVTEQAVTAAMDGDTAERFRAELYPPAPPPPRPARHRRPDPTDPPPLPPPGFSEAEMRESYLAMARASGGDA